MSENSLQSGDSFHNAVVDQAPSLKPLQPGTPEFDRWRSRLLEMLNSPDPEQRVTARSGLSKADVRQLQRLLEARLPQLTNKSDRQVTAEAISALSLFECQPPRLPWLQQIVEFLLNFDVKLSDCEH